MWWFEKITAQNKTLLKILHWRHPSLWHIQKLCTESSRLQWYHWFWQLKKKNYSPLFQHFCFPYRSPLWQSWRVTRRRQTPRRDERYSPGVPLIGETTSSVIKHVIKSDSVCRVWLCGTFRVEPVPGILFSKQKNTQRALVGFTGGSQNRRGEDGGGGAGVQRSLGVGADLHLPDQLGTV